MNSKNIAINTIGALIGILGLVVLNRWIPETTIFVEQTFGLTTVFTAVVFWVLGAALLWKLAFSSMDWMDARLFPEEHEGLGYDEGEGWTYLSPLPLSIFGAIAFENRTLTSASLEGAHLCFFKTFQCYFVDNGLYSLEVYMGKEGDSLVWENEDGDLSLSFTISQNNGEGFAVFKVGTSRNYADEITQLRGPLTEELASALVETVHAEFVADSDVSVESPVSAETLGLGSALTVRFSGEEEKEEVIRADLFLAGGPYWIQLGEPLHGDEAFCNFVQNFYRSISIRQMGYLGQLSIMQPGFLNRH
ncbi:hypothetical protein OAO91_05755 [Luminiphilus sp.]|nr:hypothetical protein [Luminiphilus sp.]